MLTLKQFYTKLLLKLLVTNSLNHNLINRQRETKWIKSNEVKTSKNQTLGENTG